MGKILHITSVSDWKKAQAEGVYTAPSLKKDGFIHCSLGEQVVEVANYNFKGKQGLVLLVIDESKLDHLVKYEDLYNLNEDYPHIYGPLNLDAVVGVVDFPVQNDGTFLLPVQI